MRHQCTDFMALAKANASAHSKTAPAASLNGWQLVFLVKAFDMVSKARGSTATSVEPAGQYTANGRKGS